MKSEANNGQETALLRRTRLRLLAWSGGLTLLILVGLGGALYASVSGALAARSTDLLAARANDLVRLLSVPGPAPDHFILGPGFGDESAGSLALIVQPDGHLVGPAELSGISGLPDTAALAAARRGTVDVRTGAVQTIPVRFYSIAVSRPDGVYVVQVLGERSAELSLLASLLAVLAFGGLAALLLSLAAGYFYAGRALIPVRAALERREAALRRQREFAANASHQLRLPLTVIGASLTDLARNRKQPVEKVGEALNDIEAEVSHLTVLVEDMLFLARADSGSLNLSPAPLDLAEVADQAASSRLAAAAARSVSLELDPRPVRSFGDEAALVRLVSRLIDAALARSPAHAVVVVRVRAEGPEAILQVEDAGAPLSEPERVHLFERFWRSDQFGAPGPAGSELGLSIAAEIAAAHGGQLAVLDRPAGGACFELRLPSTGPDRAGEQPGPKSASA